MHALAPSKAEQLPSPMYRLAGSCCKRVNTGNVVTVRNMMIACVCWLAVLQLAAAPYLNGLEGAFVCEFRLLCTCSGAIEVPKPRALTQGMLSCRVAV